MPCLVNNVKKVPREELHVILEVSEPLELIQAISEVDPICRLKIVWIMRVLLHDDVHDGQLALLRAQKGEIIAEIL